ncbi:MAG TPA: BTAD domain-containing putative transcriptional regulator [Gemmatimonadales bacterium]|nr:BTAD domain-containing putative transcriptional regulator [Gemmatimonadales bacterium]
MLHLRILGQLSLERDGEPIVGIDAQRKGLAILAILAVEGAASRDRLMALLWPESDTTRARGSLKQALHQLRQTLGAGSIVTGSPTLRLDPTAIATDVGWFLAALGPDDDDAVAIYGGPLLEGVHLGGPAELEHWVEEQRADLAGRWAAALERLASKAEAEGDPRLAAERWRRLQAHDPADSRVTIRLMLALEAAGRRAAALHEAQAHQRRLREEWDLAPDPAVDQLAAQLREGSLGPVSPPSSPYYQPAPPAPATEEHQPASARPPSGLIRKARRIPRSVVATGALLALAAAVGMLRPHPADMPGSAAPLDGNLVAVAPFQTLDPSVALWGEGLADVLIRDLDGAGPLRTVAAAVSFRDWPGNADRAAATALGQRTGAGLVVYGSVARRNADTVAVRAWVLERNTGRFAAELEVRGPESAIARLADSLSYRTLVALGRDRPIASARRVSLASRSLASLREFLRGEQFYRRGFWDSAMVHYARAVDADTAMALAYKRMSMLNGWGANAPGDQPGDEYIGRAVALNHGLAPRDSLILAADSMAMAGASSLDVGSAARYFRRALDALEEASQRYPDDPDVLYHLAEAKVHSPMAGTPAQAMNAFERVIALDPDFLPAYEHAVDLAFQVGEPGRARRYAQTAAALVSGYEESSWHLLQQVLDSGPAAKSTAVALSHTAAGQLLQLYRYLRWSTDSAEVGIALLRQFQDAGPGSATDGIRVRDSTLRARELAMALAFRGHVNAAARVGWQQPATSSAERLGRPSDPFLELALFGAVPDSLAATTFAAALDPGADWSSRGYTPRFLRGAPWWFVRGDTVALRRLANRAARVAQVAESSRAVGRGQYLSAAATGYLALARGDSAGAERLFSAIPDTLCLFNNCHHEKLTLAQLLLASGKPRQAASVLDRWGMATSYSNLASPATPSVVIASLYRARVAEALSDTATARRKYRFVVEAWRTADPELQPHVAEARAALARLTPNP